MTHRLRARMQSIRINGGNAVRIDLSDPSLYTRYFQAVEQICRIEERFDARKNAGAFAQEADDAIRRELCAVFGEDFGQMLCGANLLAVAANGERTITNLLRALQPVMKRSMEECAQKQAKLALRRAKKRRRA